MSRMRSSSPCLLASGALQIPFGRPAVAIGARSAAQSIRRAAVNRVVRISAWEGRSPHSGARATNSLEQRRAGEGG